METLINKTLWIYITKYRLTSDKEFRFRAVHSTNDGLSFICQNLHYEWKQESRLIGFDISRAFERV
jgi:hypothetical protein